MKKISITLIITLVMLMTACGTAKKATVTNPTGNTTQQTTVQTQTTTHYDEIIATLGTWQTMQTGGSLTIDVGSSFSSGVQVRMVRDEAIFISLRPMLGIEVGRLLITADSIYVIDKVHKRYAAEKVSLLTAGLPITVSTVQDMFLGRPFIIGQGTLNQANKEKATLTNDGAVSVLTPNDKYKGYSYVFTFNKSHNITSLNITPASASTSAYQVRYSNVKKTTAGNIAHTFRASGTVGKKRLTLELNYNNIEWNGSVKIDHSLPSSYSRVNANQLLNLFSN